MMAQKVAPIFLFVSCYVWGVNTFSAIRPSFHPSKFSLRNGVHLLASTEQGLFSQNSRETLNEQPYDMIVVGSGNGACGFLSHYLDYLNHTGKDARVLVLERGQNYFFTSDITHQNEWTKSYANGPIFKLHNAHTTDGRPILSGGACTMGGGGSINYTMIHEASNWLKKYLGRTEKYWNDLKRRLNKKFDRRDPMIDETPITAHIIAKGTLQKFNAPRTCSRIENIPNQNDAEPSQLYQFPTQFNTFGQRTNSGVSIVDWEDSHLRVETLVEVQDLVFAEKPTKDGDAQCRSVNVKFLDTKNTTTVDLKEGGKVILCGGAASPRLLMKQKELQHNKAIGKDVSDHIALPLGIYVKPPNITLSPKDIYGPIFATKTYEPEGGMDEDKIVVSFDFFTGKLENLLYLTSHLYLAFLLPNWVKNFVWTRPRLFELTKSTVRVVVSILNVFIRIITKGKDPEFITAIVKYNPALAGHYDENTTDNRITLRWFENQQDKKLASKVISEEGLPLLEKLGDKPNCVVRFLYRIATKVPYNATEIEKYLDNYSQNSMLSQQHLAGGCLLGSALDSGEDEPSNTAKVKGSSNIHVADLSAVPLPRISPQMTAYIVGYHIANQLYPIIEIDEDQEQENVDMT
jgi:hypothetical protein